MLIVERNMSMNYLTNISLLYIKLSVFIHRKLISKWDIAQGTLICEFFCFKIDCHFKVIFQENLCFLNVKNNKR